MNKPDFEKLACVLQHHPRTLRVAKIGLCREWTTEAIAIAKDFRKKNKLVFRLEAREIEAEPFLWHTFLRVLAEDANYICDGAGMAKNPPFFGVESEALHLVNSRLDALQLYELWDE